MINKYNNGWIPVSERLPAPGERALVTVKNDTEGSTRTEADLMGDDGEWYWNYGFGETVIAWQPFPEPYNPDHIIDPNKKITNADRIRSMTDEAPTIEPAKRGIWFFTEYDFFDCSACGEAYYNGAESTEQAKHWLINGDAYNFCPHCGADMRTEEELERKGN